MCTGEGNIIGAIVNLQNKFIIHICIAINCVMAIRSKVTRDLAYLMICTQPFIVVGVLSLLEDSKKMVTS